MKRRTVESLLVLFIFLLSATQLSAAPYMKSSAAFQDNDDRSSSSDDQDESPSAYKIGDQNMLQIKIFGEAGINNLYRVDEEGYIKHSLAGRIRLGGLTVSEAERVMEDKLADGYIINPQVNVFVLEFSHFSIVGEVRKPGNYEISGRTSVIRAISMAGGFTPVADQNAVQIIRRSPEGVESKIKVAIGRIMQGNESSEVELQAEDVIVVGKSFF